MAQTVIEVNPETVDIVKARIAGKASIKQIERAIQLVEEGKAVFVDATTVRVESQSEAGKYYLIKQGEQWCDCQWMERWPDRVCTHRIAALILYYSSYLPLSVAFDKARALDDRF